MARRRSYSSRSKRSYSKSSYRKPTRSYGSRSKRRSSGGQTIRLMLQQPAAPQMRPPFGSFMPSAMFSPFAMGMFGGGMPQGAPQGAFQGQQHAPGGYIFGSAPSVAQGGPGIAGARMVIHPDNGAPPEPSEAPGTPHFE
jgi:hypothetical protein